MGGSSLIIQAGNLELSKSKRQLQWETRCARTADQARTPPARRAADVACALTPSALRAHSQVLHIAADRAGVPRARAGARQ